MVPLTNVQKLVTNVQKSLTNMLNDIAYDEKTGKFTLVMK